MRLASILAFVACQALAACQLSLGALAPGEASPDAGGLMAEPIETTTLDAPPPEPGPAPAPVPEVAPELPPPSRSPQQIACERSGGRYALAGTTGLRTCVRPTRDSGKQCRRESDCEGLCLARSGTCAPAVPLFGCHDILQDDGRRVTLCLD